MNKQYGTDPELDKLVNSDDYKERIEAAEKGYALDKLTNDSDEVVRNAAYYYLNEHKYRSVIDWAKDNNIEIDIDEWLNSDNCFKRCEVAKYGYGLDILINDENYHVREVIAKHYYKLDKLVYDKNLITRLTMAKQRYRFDILVNDEYPYI